MEVKSILAEKNGGGSSAFPEAGELVSLLYRLVVIEFLTFPELLITLSVRCYPLQPSCPGSWTWALKTNAVLLPSENR